MKLLEIQDLTIAFYDREEPQKVVNRLSLSIAEGEIVGIVGESGSGKTMTALALMGLLKRDAKIDEGKISLLGEDFLQLPMERQRMLRGNQVSMIFQEPMTALNPTMRIGRQVEESLLLHTNFTKAERKELVYQALEEVELDTPRELYQKYPHELSGGMRQRVMIAAAMVTKPKLLIADEPTTALDVYTQQQIITLLKKLNSRHKMGILFISHNLRVVRELCEKVIVMKDGEVVERGKTNHIFQNPKEPYTKELIQAIPTRVEHNPFLERLMRREVKDSE